MRVLALKDSKDWEIERTCTGTINGHGGNGCQARLAVSKDDIFIFCDYGNPMVNGDCRCYVFKCPVCGKITSIPEQDLPKDVCENAVNEFWKLMRPRP